jgi:hypothetical protein
MPAFYSLLRGQTRERLPVQAAKGVRSAFSEYPFVIPGEHERIASAREFLAAA